jgi:hypothetical protein
VIGRREGERARAVIGLLLMGLLSSCGLPTDESGKLSVEIVDDLEQMLVGDTARLAVRVLRGSTELSGLDVGLVSSDSDVLVVDPTGTLIAVGEGRATVTARLLQYAEASPASRELFVSRGVVIASVAGEDSPAGEVRFSETLVIRGRRLFPDSLASVSIGAVPVEIVGYDPPAADDPDALESLRVVVPIAPESADLLIVHAGGGSGSRTLQIRQEDVFELFPEPWRSELGSTGAFRAPQATVAWPDYDWYRFEVPPGDWTFEVALRDGFLFLDQATEYRMELRAPTSTPDDGFPDWGREQGGYSCRQPGRYQALSRSPRREGLGLLTIPVRTATPMTMDFVASTEWGFSIPYGLTVREGYHSELPPDEAEGNDFCQQAFALELDQPRAMNFDTPADHDWYEIVVPGPTTDFSTVIRDEVEPNDGFEAADVVSPGTKIVGVREPQGDVDYFAIDLEVGQLLDIDVRSWLLPETAFGRSFPSEMMPDVAVYDEAGTEVARGGVAFSVPPESQTRGTEARIRYVPPAAGRYYIRIIGESADSFLGDFGDFMYYGMDIWAHDLAGTVTVDATVTDGAIDPEIILVGRRPTGNFPIDRVDSEGGVESLTFPASAGAYYLLVWNARANTGGYEILPSFAPSVPPAPASR